MHGRVLSHRLVNARLLRYYKTDFTVYVAKKIGLNLLEHNFPSQRPPLVQNPPCNVIISSNERRHQPALNKNQLSFR